MTISGLSRIQTLSYASTDILVTDDSWKLVFFHLGLLRFPNPQSNMTRFPFPAPAGPHLQTVLDHLSTAVIILNTDFECTYLNKQATQFTDTAQATGKNLWELLPKMSNSSLEDLVKEAIIQQEPLTVNEYFPLHDRWYQLQVLPFSDGITLLIHDYSDDLSQLDQSQNNLKFFRKAVEQAGHALYITDTNGIIQYANGAAEEITQYAEEELLGRTPKIFNSGVHDDAFYTDLWSTILSGDVWQSEIINERKNGERYIVDQTIAPITDADGSPIKFIAINREITEKKRREQRLSVLNRVLRHNLRNSATVLYGHAEELAQQTSGDVSELALALRDETRDLMRKGEIVREFDQLLRESNVMETVELSAVLHQRIGNVQRRADQTDLYIDIQPDLHVRSNSDLLAVIFDELLENAIKHNSPPDLTLTVKAQNVAEHIRVIISDDGSGIPQNELQAVTEGDETALTHTSGLGLWLAKWGTRHLGGTIEITSESTSGTKVILEFPQA